MSTIVMKASMILLDPLRQMIYIVGYIRREETFYTPGQKGVLVLGQLRELQNPKA